MTSDIPLRSCCQSLSSPPLQPPLVIVVAFGFKVAVPDYIDFIFDVRSVPNPWKLNDFKVARADKCLPIVEYVFAAFIRRG